MNIKAEDLAYDRWPEILISAGMDAVFFSQRNGPCPFCGGRDRYRWSKKHGGSWVCNHCTHGRYDSGFRMLMEHMGYDTFREAADHVRSHFGATQQIEAIARSARPRPADTGMSEEELNRNRARMQRFWNEAREIVPGNPVHRYMERRCPGIDLDLHALRYHPALEYWAPPEHDGQRPRLLGTYPAMLACAHSPNGEMVQLHKTYLTPQGEKAGVPLPKKTEYGVGASSFAVRMMLPVGDTLGVCEGIETAWGAAMLRQIPVWPCLNGPALARFELPQEHRETVRRLVIFADHDELKKGRVVNGVQTWHRPGSEYARELAMRAKQKGLRVLVIKPARTGHDMASCWQSRKCTSTTSY